MSWSTKPICRLTNESWYPMNIHDTHFAAYWRKLMHVSMFWRIAFFFSKFHITAYSWRVNTYPSMLPYLKTTCLLTRLPYLKTTHHIRKAPSKLLYNCYLIWKSTMMLERDQTCCYHIRKRAEYIGNSHLFKTIPAMAISSINRKTVAQTGFLLHSSSWFLYWKLLPYFEPIHQISSHVWCCYYFQ